MYLLPRNSCKIITTHNLLKTQIIPIRLSESTEKALFWSIHLGVNFTEIKYLLFLQHVDITYVGYVLLPFSCRVFAKMPRQSF